MARTLGVSMVTDGISEARMGYGSETASLRTTDRIQNATLDISEQHFVHVTLCLCRSSIRPSGLETFQKPDLALPSYRSDSMSALMTMSATLACCSRKSGTPPPMTTSFMTLGNFDPVGM